jgi:stage II sporulation protein D
MPNAYWKKNIAKDEWFNYLKIKHKIPIESDDALIVALNFKNDNRKSFLEFENFKIPLKTVRTDLKLKSAFFDIDFDKENNNVIFSGRGFGHGIGLSQEGAIYMTKSGYSYKEVLNFYYQNIHIIDLKELHFFKE